MLLCNGISGLARVSVIILYQYNLGYIKKIPRTFENDGLKYY